MYKKQAGFTIVELLIVIVVIAILAVITIVAYNGIQTRARDTLRKNDIAQLKKSLLAYNVVHGGVVTVGAYVDYVADGSYGGWDHSARSNWLSFLRAENGTMPADPKNVAPNTANAIAAGNSVYAYYCYPATSTSSVGYPDSAGATLYYRNEAGSIISEKFLVNACLPAVP